jgi:hypothetical protein
MKPIFRPIYSFDLDVTHEICEIHILNIVIIQYENTESCNHIGGPHALYSVLSHIQLSSRKTPSWQVFRDYTQFLLAFARIVTSIRTEFPSSFHLIIINHPLIPRYIF